MGTNKTRKGVAFFEAGSWYHRAKILRDDGTTLHTKRGGFATAAEAEKSYRSYEAEYARACRAHLAATASENFDLKEYLVYWLDEVYDLRIESNTRMLASYVLYNLILPNVQDRIKLEYVSTDYLDALLAKAAQTTKSAGNKARELLNIAMKDAVTAGYLKTNPVPATKSYKRTKPKIKVLGKEKTKVLLRAASQSNWYLEVLLALFCGLRKGEILGLKFSDFDMERQILHIQRQVTSNPVVKKGGSKIVQYNVVEKDPKTENGCRTLKVPPLIMEELDKRKMLIDERKCQLKELYHDCDYVSCRGNGLPHSASAFNITLAKLCSRNGLPHLSVHSLRHMYASILMEQGVPLIKISALLGHSSIHTTFEYYCDILDEEENVLAFMNQTFIAGEEETC